ncbi:MAG: endonuclease/exonuclease/phosphatase family protein [Nocardioidaceae bacterium]
MGASAKRRETRARSRRPRSRLAWAGALALTVGVVAGITVLAKRGNDSPDGTTAKSGQSPATKEADDPGALRVGSLNVLAARHTKKRGQAKSSKVTSGQQSSEPTPVLRPKSLYVDQVADRHGLDVMGVQGLSSKEVADLGVADSSWTAYPVEQPAKPRQRAAIAWRTSVWHRVGAGVAQPTTRGGAPIPYVKLKHKKSKRVLFVINVPKQARRSGNPDVNGNALADKLGKDGTPTLFTNTAAQDRRPKDPDKPKVESVPDQFGDAAAASAADAQLSVAKGSLARTGGTAGFRVGSYNVLGSDHTGNFNKPGDGGRVRMGRAVAHIRARDLDVVGFQEMQGPQRALFKAMTGWQLYPDSRFRDVEGHNSIGWDPSVWEVVETHVTPITYFHGETVQMPYVLLKHKASGEEVYFANFHNPATTKQRGNNQHWRRVATGREIALFNSLRKQGYPLIVTGDMNEKTEYYCPVTSQTDLRSAGGGSTSPCAPARPLRIDWVFGSPDISFSDYSISSDPRGRRASDHDLISAQAELSTVEQPAEFNLGNLVLPVGAPASDVQPWAPAKVRMRSAYEALEKNALDVVGFQELTPAQLQQFTDLAGSDWDLYPSEQGSSGDTQSSIAWRTSKWSLIDTDSGTFRVPGSADRDTRVPYVKLRNNETGQEVYIVNTFNPVSSATELSAPWRTKADELVVARVTKLARQGIPILVTGGLSQNAGESLCRAVNRAPLQLAADPQHDACAKGQVSPSDQILGTRQIAFTNFTMLRDQTVRAATDAALITADVHVDEPKSSTD